MQLISMWSYFDLYFGIIFDNNTYAIKCILISILLCFLLFFFNYLIKGNTTLIGKMSLFADEKVRKRDISLLSNGSIYRFSSSSVHKVLYLQMCNIIRKYVLCYIQTHDPLASLSSTASIRRTKNTTSFQKDFKSKFQGFHFRLLCSNL